MSRASPQPRKAVQLLQVPEKLDILGKGQWWLLGDRVFQLHQEQIVAALQNKKAVCYQSTKLTR
jgi:hypothetical protein